MKPRCVVGVALEEPYDGLGVDEKQKNCGKRRRRLATLSDGRRRSALSLGGRGRARPTASGHRIGRGPVQPSCARVLVRRCAERCSDVARPRVNLGAAAACPQETHSIRKPEIAREITSCWISLVPSKIVWIFASRCQRSTGYSRV